MQIICSQVINLLAKNLLDSCLVTKCLRFDIVLKLKIIHGRTYPKKKKAVLTKAT